MLTQKFCVETPLMRPLWNSPPLESVKSWRLFGEDFIQFTEERGKKTIIGVGHSIGGTLLLFAAINNPDLFSKIILLAKQITIL